MKWILVFVFWAVAAVPILRADQGADLFNQAIADISRGDYKSAAPILDQVLKDYPSTPNIDEARINAGVAHLHLAEYDKAVAALAVEAGDKAPAQYRAPALFYTGYAQLLKAGKQTGGDQKKTFSDAAETLGKLITYVTASPTPDNRDYLELALHSRALAYLYLDDLADAEKDVSQLLQQFPGSLQKPDYLVMLGSLYAREASEDLRDKKPDADMHAAADKAIAAFDQAIADPTALVQGNEAKMSKAEVLYLLASLSPQDKAGYEKAIEAFRQVVRKDDLIPGQQANVEALRTKNQEAAQHGQSVDATNKAGLVIGREEDRLEGLKTQPDPILQALLRIAQCYNAIGQSDEARTVLRRMAHAPLTAEQKSQADFALLYSYVLSHQIQKADKALDTYLAAHKGDPQAAGLSVQIGNDLLKKGDGQGALDQANRSLSDFPNGPYVSDAIVLKVAALTMLGRKKEADAASDDFLKTHANSPAAITIALSTAQRQASNGDLEGALASYEKVRDSGNSKELQAAGAAGVIQTLQSLNRFDDVIAQSKAFADKYPDNPALPSILVMQGLAMDKKHDPGAIAVLEDEAKRFPADTANTPSAFALFYVMNIYQRANQIPQMVQAAEALEKAFPTQYAYLSQAADTVSQAYIKQRKFDEATAAYQSLAAASDPDVAATAQAKMGSVALAAAKTMQSGSQKEQAQKLLDQAEKAYIGVLKNHPDQLSAVDDAFQGLYDVMGQRHAWGVIKASDYEDYLGKATSELTSPDMKAHVELAKAGLVFLDRKNGTKHYPEALARFKAVTSAHPGLKLTHNESGQFGLLMLAAKDYTGANKVYTRLLQSAGQDLPTLADGYYGLGATALAQNNFAVAKDYFTKMKALPNGALYSPHILDANYGLAYATEQTGGDLDGAKQAYADIMRSPSAGNELLAKAMLGYGRILEKEGHATTPATAGTIEFATHYYQQVDTFYGPSVPELSAEGLYDAAQAYAKVGDQANAKKIYDQIIANYSEAAPDWAAKATAAEGQ